MLNPRLFLARRRTRQAIHPGYTESLQAKLAFPPEIYAYPTAARRDFGWRAPKVPVGPQAPAIHSSTSWLRTGYGIVIMALWTAAANVTPGA